MMLALLYQANKNVTFAVKTPHGITESRIIKIKVMQGDVMAPLMSSNFGMIVKQFRLKTCQGGPQLTAREIT